MCENADMKSVKESNSQPLPNFLRPLFWEYDFSKLFWPADKELVLRKILEDGDWLSLRWLRSMGLFFEVKEYIVKTEGRGLTPQKLRFWELVLDLKHSTVSKWIENMRSNPWHNRQKNGTPDASQHAN